MRDETCPYCNRDITGDYRHRCTSFDRYWQDHGIVLSADYRSAKEIWQAAIEEAIKVCDFWKDQNHVYVNGAIGCGKDIRNLK
jgi:hypothetical protein